MKSRIEPTPYPDPTECAHTADTTPGHNGSALIDVGFGQGVHRAAQVLENARAAGDTDRRLVDSAIEKSLP
jgi:hypothetical protein